MHEESILLNFLIKFNFFQKYFLPLHFLAQFNFTCLNPDYLQFKFHFIYITNTYNLILYYYYYYRLNYIHF